MDLHEVEDVEGFFHSPLEGPVIGRGHLYGPGGWVKGSDGEEAVGKDRAGGGECWWFLQGVEECVSSEQGGGHCLDQHFVFCRNRSNQKSLMMYFYWAPTWNICYFVSANNT